MVDPVLHIVVEIECVEDGTIDFFCHVILWRRVNVVLDTNIGEITYLLFVRVFEFNAHFAIVEMDVFYFQEGRYERVFAG